MPIAKLEARPRVVASTLDLDADPEYSEWAEQARQDAILSMECDPEWLAKGEEKIDN